MDKISTVATGLFCLLFNTCIMAASTCQDVTQQFYDYNKGLPGISSQNFFPYPWQDMSWLIAKLGPPAKTDNFIQTIATWKKYSYSLISVDGKVINSQGLKPQPMQNYAGQPSIEDANKEMGPPDTLETGSMVESSWTCDTNSNLSITSNQTQNQEIVSYGGTYCPENDAQHCQNFSNYHANFPDYKYIGFGLQKADLYLQHPPFQPQYSDAQAIDLAAKQTLKMVNDQLHGDVQTTAQLQTFAIKTLTNYYSHLRTCSTGVYQYAHPFILGGKLISDNEVAPFYFIAAATIQGITDNKCIVQTVAKIGKNTGTMTCKYTPQDLALFTDTKAAMDATYPSNFDVNQVAVTKTLLKECQIYFNGGLLTNS